MKYLVFFIFTWFIGCVDNDAGHCPYDMNYNGHFLKVPITISPHKMIYSVGDTIRISTIFSDSIEDLGTQQTFKIEGFPFIPISGLYRFYDGMNWDAGYRVNELSIDSSYNAVYNYSSNYADGFKAYTIYKDGVYYFDFYLVLKEKGRYIHIMTDLYQEHNGTGNSELNAQANAITFEGKCPDMGYYICSMIEGDDHLEFFEDELVHLDKEVYRDNYTSVYAENSYGIFGTGDLGWEFTGTFGFEVVE
ncbi:MAG: hypothetical protein U9R19_18530 [Bacteroidota bacterium]|nr:hypothetical protein [Bacteroidota bacterium]